MDKTECSNSKLKGMLIRKVDQGPEGDKSFTPRGIREISVRVFDKEQAASCGGGIGLR